MATSSNPFSGVYGGGAVVFNSQPFVQHFLQVQAQKQARDQAMDNYYRDQLNSITPTGVRDQDLGNGKGDGKWLDKFNQFKDLGITQKDLLLHPEKDGYQTVRKFNTLKNELQGGIVMSKEAASRDQNVWQAKLAGKWNPTENDVALADANSRSIYDPTHQTLDLSRLSLNRTPLDINKWLTGVQSNFKRGTQVAAPDVIDDKQGLRTTHTHDIYSPENVKAMADMANINVTNSGKESSDYDYFDNLLHSPALPQLQTAYSAVYGNDKVDTAGKAAAAYSMLHNNIPTNESSKTVPYESPAAKLARSQQEATFKSNLERGNMRYKDWLDNGGTGVLNDRVNSLITSAKLHPVPVAPGGTTPGYTSYDLPKSTDVEKAVMGTLKKGDPKPVAYRYVEKDGEPGIQAMYYSRTVSPDGKTYTGIERQNGKPVIDESKTKFIPLEEFRSELGKTMFTGKQLERNLGQKYTPPKLPTSTPTPTPKTKLTKGAFDNIGQ